MRYGHDKTIHRTGHLDVEVDVSGKVVAVWFRCLRLPFKEVPADIWRALEVEKAYREDPGPTIVAIEVDQ